ncbi:MAG: trigger factor [Mycoplasma sp.]
MKISKVEKQAGKVVCTVTLESNEWSEIIRKERESVAKKVKIDGFRPGKVPMDKALAVVSAESVLVDAANKAINKSIKLVDENEEVKNLDVEVFPSPSVEIGEKFSATELEFSLIYWVMPEVTIENYKKLDVEIIEPKVEDAEVENEINNLLAREKMLAKKESGIIAKGDQAKFDFTGSVDGVEFAGGKAENFELEIGSGQFIPGFEDQMVGIKVGEEKDITVTFPEEYHSKDLAGKEAVFKIKLHEVSEISKPKLDEEFIKNLKLPNEEVKTPAQFKDFIKDAILKNKQQENTQQIAPLLNEAIVKNCKHDEIPEVAIEEEKKMIRDNFIERITQMNFKFKDFLKMTGQSEEDFEKELSNQAKNSIVIQCAIEDIAKKEKIEVSEAELNEQYDLIAKSHGKSIEEIKTVVNEELLKTAILKEVVTKKIIEWNTKKAK